MRHRPPKSGFSSYNGATTSVYAVANACGA